MPTRLWILIASIWLLPLASCAPRPEAAQPKSEAAKPRAEKPIAKPKRASQEKKTPAPKNHLLASGRTLEDLVDPKKIPAAAEPTAIDSTPRLPTIDESNVQAAGIRKLGSGRLTLYTDLPPDSEIDELPRVFEQAFPQWCDYFQVDQQAHAPWRMNAYLMSDKEKFIAAGLLPDDLPEFLNGYARGHELWMVDQSSPYYRRHLLLHEGTHGFMFTVLGHCGPPWYMEGMAEMLATHRWHDGQLRLNCFPRSKDETPKLGRIEIVQQAYAESKAQNLPEVMKVTSVMASGNEAYAWCWAASAFLDGHPRYQKRFRQMRQLLDDKNFTELLWQHYAQDSNWAIEEFQAFVANLVYGYDLERTAIDFAPGRPITAETVVQVAADRGWQNTGLQLQAGQKYQLTAQGLYQVADQPKIWWCEPGGVTIRYIQGQPLGLLQAAVRSDEKTDEILSPLLKPISVGSQIILEPTITGTLYLRINDSPAELHDNAGQVEVTITPLAP